MRGKDILIGIRNFWREYRRYKIGLLGLVFLVFFIGMAVFAPLITPAEAYYRWSDITYWDEHPKGVPPEWVNFFSAKKSATSTTIKPKFVEKNITFTYNYQLDIPPSDIIIKVSTSATDQERQLSIHVSRPDGIQLNNIVRIKHTGGEARIRFTSSEVRDWLIAWAREYETQENLEKIRGREAFVNPILILFSKNQTGILLGTAENLKGQYDVVVQLSPPTATTAKAVFTGSVFGVLGTDTLGRDLLVGIVWGSRLALLIGLLTAVLSETVGMIYGVASAYKGGVIDEGMQRILETVASLPFLPILIILSYIMRPTIWNLALLMAVFFWVGPVKTVRSMALQLKEQPYVEAAKALGASGWRIVARHITPQILPYFFASIALSVPGAILTEAGISFLMGATGVSEPTWGRILHDAQRFSATINGMWWWVLSPGLLISLTGLTFVLLGSALDRILNPKLRR